MILNRDETVLLVIDPQVKLLPHIDGGPEVIAACHALIDTALIFQVPTIVTVQYVQGLGPLEPSLADTCATHDLATLEKNSFSVCADDSCRTHLLSMGRRSVIVAGIEAHVCVQQTVLDLFEIECRPVVCADAISSRRPRDRALAIDRMRQAGAVITTTEAVMFELCRVAGTAEFKSLLAAVKRFDQARTVTAGYAD